MESLLISVLFLMFFFIVLMSIRFLVRKNFVTFMILLCQITLFSFLFISLINKVEVASYIRVPAQIIGISIPFIIIINDLKNRNNEVGYLHILDFLHDIFFQKKHVHNEYISLENIKIPNSIHNIINIRKLEFIDIKVHSNVYKRIHSLLVDAQTKAFKGKYQEAYDIYNYFYKIFTDNPIITYNYGCLCFYLRLFNEAENVFLKTLDNIEKHKIKTNIKSDKHKLKESPINKVDDLLKNKSLVKFNLAVTRHAAGKLKEAMEGYQNILNETPGHKLTVENLASTSIS